MSRDHKIHLIILINNEQLLELLILLILLMYYYCVLLLLLYSSCCCTNEVIPTHNKCMIDDLQISSRLRVGKADMIDGFVEVVVQQQQSNTYTSATKIRNSVT